jgi:hypothetical protein
MKKARLNLSLSTKLYSDLEQIAEERGISLTEVARRGLALIKIAHEGQKAGQLLGLAADRSRLDTVIVGLD